MRIWIDLAAPAHVWLFAPLADELRAGGHDVLMTARDYGETARLCEKARLEVTVIGRHGGRRLAAKAGRFAARVAALVRFGRTRQVDLCASHNSYGLAVAASLLGRRCVTLMDYEYQPANHLSFRLADRVILPVAFDPDARRRFGAAAHKTQEYDGCKEEIYLAGFVPAPGWRDSLVPIFATAGVVFSPQDHPLVTVRPPPATALYHRFSNPLFPELLTHLNQGEARTILLPRDEEQRRWLEDRLPRNAAIPATALDGRNLVAHSDWVISAGGTMAREAAVLGVPAVSLFAGRVGGVDRSLIAEGRLHLIESRARIAQLRVDERRGGLRPVGPRVRQQVMNLLTVANGEW